MSDPTLISVDAMTTGLNQALDDILDIAGREDERIVDIANLISNAGAHLAQSPDDTLFEAIEANYSEAPSLVLSWIQS